MGLFKKANDLFINQEKVKESTPILQCPECGSNAINQFRMLSGPIWCHECGFRAEEKDKYNPFLLYIPKEK